MMGEGRRREGGRVEEEERGWERGGRREGGREQEGEKRTM